MISKEKKKTRPKNANRARRPGCLLVSLTASRAPAAPPSLVPVAVGRPPRRAPRAAAGPPRRRDDRLLLSGVVDVSQSPSALPSPPPSAVAPGAGPPPLRRARSYPRRTSRDPGNGEVILPATSRHTRRRGDPGWQAVILDPRPRDEATPVWNAGYSQSQLYSPSQRGPRRRLLYSWRLHYVLLAHVFSTK